MRMRVSSEQVDTSTEVVQCIVPQKLAQPSINLYYCSTCCNIKLQDFYTNSLVWLQDLHAREYTTQRNSSTSRINSACEKLIAGSCPTNKALKPNLASSSAISCFYIICDYHGDI